MGGRERGGVGGGVLWGGETERGVIALCPLCLQCVSVCSMSGELQTVLSRELSNAYLSGL